MPQYEFVCVSCRRPFSKILTCGSPKCHPTRALDSFAYQACMLCAQRPHHVVFLVFQNVAVPDAITKHMASIHHK
jgi:hypothetical protein